MASFLLRQLAYLIEGFKLPLSLLFYGSIIAAFITLSTKFDHTTAISRAAVEPSAFSITHPYDIAHPYNYLAAATQAKQAQAAAVTAGPVWPLHGKITTYFGAPDYPYESSHTGLDISSGRPSGQTNVVAFKAGTVTNVIRSGYGYGNHVIIDHGNGLTSLYGHLYSIAVHQGQQVHAGDIIGTEGSTGASTGPHVHFEIRQNNIPQNPLRYIPGIP